MALPRDTDPYEPYTDQLVYFGARLAANPDTAALADAVDKLLDNIDVAHDKLRLARRDEIRARARRDHEDGLSDTRVRRVKRGVDVLGDPEISSRLFPRGVGYTVAPRGRPQLERLAQLALAIDELAASPRAAAHADAEELGAILGKGKATLAELIATLTPVVEAWEAEALDVARAVDGFSFVRSEGVAQLGAVLGELRAKLGGNSKAAYGYTQQGRTSGGGGSEDEEAVAGAEAEAEG